MNKPFLYYTDFIVKNTSQNCEGNEIINNIQCIRSYLIASEINMTVNAMAAIISASAIVAGLNPNKISTAWHYIMAQDGPVFIESYGLWQVDTWGATPNVDTQIDNLIYTLSTGIGYTAQDDGNTTLLQFLSSYNTTNLSLIFIKNYTLSGSLHNQSYWQDAAWLNSCMRNYAQILDFINNNPPKYNPKALAILLKKRKRRWYK